MAHIVIIEDDPEVRATLNLLLERQGHRVTDGYRRKIGALLRDDPADLVITDMLMPEVDGVDVLREVSKLAPPPPPPVLAVTGGGRASARIYLNIASSLGATDTLAKPFSRDELIMKVEALLRPETTGN